MATVQVVSARATAVLVMAVVLVLRARMTAVVAAKTVADAMVVMAGITVSHVHRAMSAVVVTNGAAGMPSPTVRSAMPPSRPHRREPRSRTRAGKIAKRLRSLCTKV